MVGCGVAAVVLIVSMLHMSAAPLWQKPWSERWPMGRIAVALGAVVAGVYWLAA